MVEPIPKDMEPNKATFKWLSSLYGGSTFFIFNKKKEQPSYCFLSTLKKVRNMQNCFGNLILYFLYFILYDVLSILFCFMI